MIGVVVYRIYICCWWKIKFGFIWLLGYNYELLKILDFNELDIVYVRCSYVYLKSLRWKFDFEVLVLVVVSF